MSDENLKEELQKQRSEADAEVDSVAQPKRDQPERPSDLAVDYFYNETIRAMKLAGYTDDEINKSSYVKNLKTFLAMDPELDNKMKDEVNNKRIQEENREKRFHHEREAFYAEHRKASYDTFSSRTKAYKAAMRDQSGRM